jgi:hypothetical protein
MFCFGQTQHMVLSLVVVVILHVIHFTYYMFTHTFVAPHECTHIGGAFLDFLEKCANDILGQS